MRIYDCARVIRSKNAGPFALTIDLLFDDGSGLQRVLDAPAFNAENVARLYGVQASAVQIHPFPRALAIKVTMPRADASSGAPEDRDVYGCQQHFPLALIDV